MLCILNKICAVANREMVSSRITTTARAIQKVIALVDVWVIKTTKAYDPFRKYYIDRKNQSINQSIYFSLDGYSKVHHMYNSHTLQFILFPIFFAS